MANELLQSLRGVRRNPGFALLSIVTLALGIGSSTAVFSGVNGVLLQPLQFSQPDRIVSVNTRTADRPNGTKMTGAEFTGIYWVTPEFFTVFGHQPAVFTESNAVVGEAFAVRNFGDPQRALGQ